MSHLVGDWLNEAAAFRSFSTGAKNDQLFTKAWRYASNLKLCSFSPFLRVLSHRVEMQLRYLKLFLVDYERIIAAP
jgi:hypothetical protein